MTIDCLHSPLSIESVAHMILAAEYRGMPTLVRVPENNPTVILQYLDVGAMAISAPDMDNAKAAKELVDAVKFPPEGKRSMASTHAADYGLTESSASYMKAANKETMVIGIIESKEGLDNIEEILAVPGFDAVVIGTTDLSNALGIPGQIEHPLVLQAVERVLAAAKKTEKNVSITRNAVESPARFIKQGFNIVNVHAKALFVDAAKKYMKEVTAIRQGKK